MAETEFKGTPGQWATRNNCGDGLTVGVLRKIKGGEAFIPLGHSSAARNPGFLHGSEPIEADEAIANGRLWAASKDLLAELHDLVGWLEDNQRSIEGMFSMDDLLAPARAALSKALEGDA